MTRLAPTIAPHPRPTPESIAWGRAVRDFVDAAERAADAGLLAEHLPYRSQALYALERSRLAVPPPVR